MIGGGRQGKQKGREALSMAVERENSLLKLSPSPEAQTQKLGAEPFLVSIIHGQEFREETVSAKVLRKPHVARAGASSG